MSIDVQAFINSDENQSFIQLIQTLTGRYNVDVYNSLLSQLNAKENEFVQRILKEISKI